LYCSPVIASRDKREGKGKMGRGRREDKARGKEMEKRRGREGVVS